MSYERAWTRYNASSTRCTMQVQVFANDGTVTLVHPDSQDPSLTRDSGNVFRVRWAEGRYPAGRNCTVSPIDGAPTGCTTFDNGVSCVCNVAIDTLAVYNDVANLPPTSLLERTLTIGAPAPEAFGQGAYVRCMSAACTAAVSSSASSAGSSGSSGSSADARLVAVYTHASSAGALDQRSIFAILRNGTRLTYLANKASTVRVGRPMNAETGAGGGYSFRNPPKFHSFLRPSIRDAAYETEALLEHLFYHKNVAPFMARRLIQRMVMASDCL